MAVKELAGPSNCSEEIENYTIMPGYAQTRRREYLIRPLIQAQRQFVQEALPSDTAVFGTVNTTDEHCYPNGGTTECPVDNSRFSIVLCKYPL